MPVNLTKVLVEITDQSGEVTRAYVGLPFALIMIQIQQMNPFGLASSWWSENPRNLFWHSDNSLFSVKWTFPVSIPLDIF